MLSVNYAGTFGTPFANDASAMAADRHVDTDSTAASAPTHSPAHDTILVPDAQLLFSGDFKRLGSDLLLSKDGHEFLVTDYFRGEKRAFLASPDGANLSGHVVEALTGHVQYAQAGDSQSAAKDIGQVSKLVGTATVIRNGVLVELHGGDRVYKGDVVQAGASSSCTITFVDGSVFGLSSNARMVLNEMVYDQAGASNSALISLVRGTVSFVAGETAKHGDMKVETPVATMGIRGTAVLVEIGFEIPSDGKAAPVNFQVLVEPDGTTGSYIVYSKSDPTVVLGTIDKAGQVYSVSGSGSFSNLPSPEMSQVAANIIQQVFTQRFQGYVPDKLIPTPQSGSNGGGGSPPPSPPSDNLPKLHDAPGDGSVTIPVTVKIPDGNGGTKDVTIPVGVGIVDIAPTLIKANLSVLEGGTTLLKASDIGVFDPDSTSFTFTATTTHGTFQINTGGNVWVVTTTFTSADLTAGHVRFISDGSDIPPTISLVANDGHLNSLPFNVAIDFNKSSLSSTAGVSINLSNDGATQGFTFPGAGNVTTPGTPEDRIVLGYHTPDLTTHVLNSDPMLGVHDFRSTGTTIGDDGRSIATALDAGNNITLTQKITLGVNASYFTTTIDVSNGNTAGSIDGVRFLRNFDPDQDVQKYGDYSTFNDVVQNPTKDEPFAIISAKGAESGVTISMIGFGMAWRASVYGFTNTDPYADAAYNHPVDPNGAKADLSLTLTYDFGSIAAGAHQQISYITTDNIATSGDNALFGTAGCDIINGLGGNDLLIGLGGADTFVFTSGTTGHATILDFSSGSDKIQLADFGNTFNPNNDGSFNAWLADHASSVAHAADSGTDVLIDLDLTHPGQDTILLQNTALSNLHASDFIVDFVNHAPVVTGPVTDTATEDGSPNTLDALANASDDDHDTLSVVNVPSLPHGVTYNSIDHTFSLDPHDAAFQSLAENAQTVVTVNYGISDGTATTNASVSWTVTGTNDAPQISTAGAQMVGDGSPGNPITISGWSLSDPDSGDSVTPSASADHGSAEINASSLTYTPPASPPSTATVALTATDSHDASDTVNFIFNVSGTGPVTLTGTDAKDVFFASSHQDTFVFAQNSNHDTIVGFTTGQDHIDLTQFATINTDNFASTVTIEQVGGNSLVHLDPTDPTDHNTILVKGVTSLSVNDFIIHPGSV